MNMLLDRLNQVDPTTYEKIVSGIPIYPRSIYYVFDPGARKPRAEMYKDGWIRFADLPNEVACAWLQACLQEAIIGKGWPYQIAYYPPEGPTKWFYRAYLWPEIKCVIEQSDSPAKSLLAAYIAACEAMT